MKTNMKTSKKVKVVGTQQYLNTTTGRMEDFQVTTIEERDFNFTKVWMRDFISALDLVGNQKTRIAYWVVENLNRENMLTCTYRQISEKTGISLETVRITMKILIEADFLRRVNGGCYVVNPNVIYKGTRSGRLNVLNCYVDADKPVAPPLSDEERLVNLLEAIKSLQIQAIALQERIDARNANAQVTA